MSTKLSTNVLDLSLEEYIHYETEFFRSTSHGKFFAKQEPSQDKSCESMEVDTSSVSETDESRRKHKTRDFNNPTGCSEFGKRLAQENRVSRQKPPSSCTQYERKICTQNRVSPFSIKKMLPKDRKSSSNQRDFWQHNDRKSWSGMRSSRVNPFCKFSPSSWILVSNLPYCVTQDELRIVFAAVGRVKRVYLHFDRFGRSRGTAAIQYHKVGDALTAVRTYHLVTFDGRPMKVRIASRL